MTDGLPTAARDRRPARPRWLVFVGLAAGIIVVDQVAKAWIVSGFAVGAPTDLLGDYLRITITHNTGALFGMFRDQAPLFALFSLGVIALIVWYESRSGSNLLLSIALGLLLGGAIGNLLDRIRLGYVVDFVDMGIGSWRFYTYNVADAAITTSIVLLLVASLLPGVAARFADA